MHIRQKLGFVKSRDKKMFLFIYAASGPLYYSLHLHRALCNNARLLWSYRKVLQRQLELTAVFSTVNRTIKTEIQKIYDFLWLC